VTGVSRPSPTAVREYIVSTITEGARMPTLNQISEASHQYQRAVLTKAGAKDIDATVEGSLQVTVNHSTGKVFVQRTTFHEMTMADFREVQNAHRN
jgi:hypothetical protein